MFKTELHVHSNEVSPCCDMPTPDIAERYVAAGYTTITVTDHFTPAFCREDGLWQDRVEHFLSGYRRFREASAGRLFVLLGFELRFEGYANDYLVYGLGADFLRGARELPFVSRREACERIHEAGGMIFQAHPFRNGMTILPPEGLDGIEILNAHNGHDSRNALAYAFAKHHGLRGIAGSDFHHTYNANSAGIMTEDPITSEEELVNILRAGTYRTFGEVVPRA